MSVLKCNFVELQTGPYLFPFLGTVEKMDNGSSQSVTNKLIIGTSNLPQREAGLVRALLHFLCSSDEGFPWKYADAPPYDLVLVDAQAAHAVQEESQPIARMICLLADENPDNSPNTIVRPIRYTELERWLFRKVEDLKSGIGAGTDKANVPPSEPHGGPTEQERFKLLRWPPAVLLQRDPCRIRMATLMSGRAMSLKDLSKLSQDSEERCRTFVVLCQALDLIEVQTSVNPQESSGTVSEKNNASTNNNKSLGIVNGLRRRLGLSQK